MQKRSESLSDMLQAYLVGMSLEQVRALREELQRSLPAYIEQAVERAKQQAAAGSGESASQDALPSGTVRD